MDFKDHEEELDDVVGEIDVVLSRPPSNDELHVLQYPLRHAKVGLGKDRRVTGVNIRPQYGRVEVQLSVFPDDPSSMGDNDDYGHGQPCTESFDGAQTDAEEKNIGRIQKLRSRSHLEAPTCNYAVGSLVEYECDGESKLKYALVPVHAVSQLRPTFDYLDKFEEAKLKQRVVDKMIRMGADGAALTSNINPETGAAGNDDVSPLQVSFKRRESEKAAERRRNSHASLREREEGEAWIELEFKSESSSESKERLNKLFESTICEEPVLENNGDVKTKYEDMFMVHTKGSRMDLAAKGTMNANETSQRALKVLATNAAVIQVVAYARVVQFTDLFPLIGERPVKEVLTALRVAGYCLRGCWVAKKGLKDMRRLTSVAERFDACRILILALFRKTPVVAFKMAEDAIGTPLIISEKAIRSVLSEVSDEPVRGKGWWFKRRDDIEFADNNLAIVRAQEVEWDNRVAKAREVVEKFQRQIQTRRQPT